MIRNTYRERLWGKIKADPQMEVEAGLPPVPQHRYEAYVEREQRPFRALEAATTVEAIATVIMENMGTGRGAHGLPYVTDRDKEVMRLGLIRLVRTAVAERDVRS